MASEWQQRFRAPTIYSIDVASGAPHRGLVVSDHGGAAAQVHAWDVPSGTLRPMTDSATGIFDAWIAPDGKAVYWHADQQGDEFGHIVRQPFDGGDVEDTTPSLGSYTLRGVGFSASGNRFALNPVDDDGFHLYCLDLGPDGKLGEPRRVHHSRHEAWLALLSAGGGLAAVISTERAGGQRRYSTLVYDIDGNALVADLTDGPASSVEAAAFAPVDGDDRLLATTNTSGFMRPFLWDVGKGERRDLAVERLSGDVVALDWSPDGGTILLCQLHLGAQRLHLFDLAADELRAIDQPDGTYYLPHTTTARFAGDGTVLALHHESSSPARVVALDATSSSPPRVVLADSGDVTGRRLRSVTFPSSDGAVVQGWLGVPDGDGPFPAILDVHGGPHWISPDAFDVVAQTWLDHGFAWLTVNYRGSLGCGRDFKEQIWGDVGHWELEDMVSARAFLVSEGIAASEAVFVHGASYGGYLTLFALGKRPELWAGGLAEVAAADWAEGYKEESPALQAAVAGWFGGTPEERPDAYAASSPITYADAVQAPVMVFHARNDSRVGVSQMESYISRLQALGKRIDVIWSEGGHSYPPGEEMIDLQAREVRFAQEVLASTERRS